MRYTSHLDLHRTWERTLRRAGLPLAYSLGFNPRPKINLASALPLGFTSQAEVVDIILERQLPLSEVDHRLREAVPPGLTIENIEAVDPHVPTLQSQLAAVEYQISLKETPPDLEIRLKSVLKAEYLARERRGKEYDLRPLILDIQLLPEDENGSPRLLVRLTAREGATGRPDELLLTLGVDPLDAHIHRTALIFTGDTTR